MAIDHALAVLNWHENLPKDEVPPQHIWEDPEGLEQWWKRVDEKRTTRSDPGLEEVEDEDMVGNDLAKQFRRLTDDD